MEPDIVSLMVEEMTAAGVKFVGGESAAIEEADGKKTVAPRKQPSVERL